MEFKSRLKPEGSYVAGIAVAGGVWAIYNMTVGPMSTAHASDANHPANATSLKKAGYMAFVFVAGLTVIAKDSNVGLLGFGSIIALQATYRHAIMASPVTGQMVPPAGSGYTPAGGNVVDFANAGAMADGPGYTG
jgi:hypothetical protein